MYSATAQLTAWALPAIRGMVASAGGTMNDRLHALMVAKWSIADESL